MTVILTLSVSAPSAFVAVMVNVAWTDRAVGVPVRWPVVALNERPLGGLGLIVKLVATPFVTVGLLTTIAAPFVYVAASAEYASRLGTRSLTLNFTVAVTKASVFAAVITYV